jgi:large subunit ribosomal protein L29
MTKQKATELRDKSIEELEATFQDTCRELFHLTNEYQVSKKLEQPHRLKTVRRNKARILTVLNEKRSINNG